ncbi:MAG: hypothetical protein IKZ87_08190 [Actinomycetaceae bacterium]|nr:hypothetical protein [Actinomycetaceae bacterium]
MSEEEERFYSVKEFAELTGLSTQAVYKRLATSLQPFSKKVGNRRMISEQALRLFSSKNVTNVFGGFLEGSDKETLMILREQLTAKDKQLAAKDRQIEELNKRLAEAQSMAQSVAQANAVLASQAQQLQAIETQERQERRRRWFRRG